MLTQLQVNFMTDTEKTFRKLSPETVRIKTGLSRSEMASVLGMSASGYEDWEEGLRKPGGAAYRLLYLLEADPNGLIEKLNAGGGSTTNV